MTFIFFCDLPGRNHPPASFVHKCGLHPEKFHCCHFCSVTYRFTSRFKVVRICPIIFISISLSAFSLRFSSSSLLISSRFPFILPFLLNFVCDLNVLYPLYSHLFYLKSGIHRKIRQKRTGECSPYKIYFLHRKCSTTPCYPQIKSCRQNLHKFFFRISTAISHIPVVFLTIRAKSLQ